MLRKHITHNRETPPCQCWQKTDFVQSIGLILWHLCQGAIAAVPQHDHPLLTNSRAML
jgi:hypothetical protein